MPVLLRTSNDLPMAGWEDWCSVRTPGPALDPAAAIADLPRLLEAAFDSVTAEWQHWAREFGNAPDGVLAHMPDCAANVSDFGLMLAWSALVESWAASDRRVLVICDDPWLFRHLAGQAGVIAGPAPKLWRREAGLALRGLAARLLVSLRMARAAIALRRQRSATPGGGWLLVYGHPGSKSDGFDAYFGTLMEEMTGLRRLLHVDCPPNRALALEGGGRTLSLHAFGSPVVALTLLLARWCPPAGGRLAWLVRRAAALEGSTGTAAMVRWQIHCQGRFLAGLKPQAVAWPWENHGWERVFVRVSTAAGIRTIGYQHSTVGWREWNYSPAGNPDGPASLPAVILAVGASDRGRLVRYGVPAERIVVGGARRYSVPAEPPFDPAAPVFVALPFDGKIAAEMMAAIRPLGVAGRRFVVKEHPMSPFWFEPSVGVARTKDGLGDQPGVSAVLYCMTTVGLEAVLAKLPTLRFLPAARPVVDVAPDGVSIAAATAAELAAALDDLPPPPALSRAGIFAVPDPVLWRRMLAS